MKKILTIVGARPQFIKAAVLSRGFHNENNIKELIIHTGQHFDAEMSEIFFNEMEIPRPAYNLQISGLNHGAMTGKMMGEIEEICVNERPDAILVYGDTNSTLAGALVGSKLHIPIIHVEAGLRSFNMKMPEEINRILTDRVSSFLFCPTESAVNNLLKEGINTFGSQIFLVGDVMEDASIFYKAKSDNNSLILKNLNLLPNSYILFTCHRAENTNDKSKLLNIIEGLNNIANFIKIIWPLHPRLKNEIENYQLSENISLINPVGYLDMLKLINSSQLIITDSGGLQKEAYFFNKYCITIREETEWIELVKFGYNKLVGSDSESMLKEFLNLKDLEFTKNHILYGGGLAGSKMVQLITNLI